ncbi:MAG: YceI family protein [Patescibacteria group bacterium]
MKKILFVLLLGLGLVTLSACTSQTKDVSENNANKSVSLTDGTYQVSTSSSKVAWKASKVVGNSHTGTLAIKSGNLTITGGNLTGGNLLLDMKSIKTDENIEALVKHLNSEDFFATETYPEANLVITSVARTPEEGLYAISGDLTLKGKTAPISFNLMLNQENNKVLAVSELELDRTTWDVRYGSGKFFQDLGDKVIKDEIDLSVSLEAIK